MRGVDGEMSRLAVCSEVEARRFLSSLGGIPPHFLIFKIPGFTEGIFDGAFMVGIVADTAFQSMWMILLL